MHEDNKGYPVWPEPTEGLVWYKSQKVLNDGASHSATYDHPCSLPKVPNGHMTIGIGPSSMRV